MKENVWTMRNFIPESEDSKEMTVIFELLVQTQLIISHLWGKSIKLRESYSTF